MVENKSLQRLALLGRLSSITEELEEIAKHSDKTMSANLKSQITPAQHEILKKDFSTQAAFYSVCRHMVLSGLLSGRYVVESYVTGKLMGLKIPIKSDDHFSTVCRKNGLEVMLVDINEERVVVQIRKGLTACQVNSAKHPICHFESGFLSGLIERWKKRKVNLQEVVCSAISSRYCKFVSGKAVFDDSENISAAKGSLPLLPIEQYSDENIRLLTSLASHALAAIENTLLFEKTKRQSLIDMLTGVYNHRYFHQVLKSEIKRAERHVQPISLLMIDVDDFKKINDIHGHPKGDKVLKILSQIFVNSTREIDIVARYGGDEFMIILPQTDHDGALVVANRIIKCIAHTPMMQNHGKNIFVSVSIGIAAKAKKNVEAHSLIEIADLALLRAKKNGKGKIVCKDEIRPKSKRRKGN